jgi:lactocepin
MMARKKKRKTGKKVAAGVIASALVFSNLGFLSSASAASNIDFESKIKQIRELKAKDFKKIDLKDYKQKKVSFKETDKVRVIVEVEGQTPLEYATKQGILYKELSEDKKDYFISKILRQQQNVKDKMKAKGIKMDYKLNFTTAFNGFSGMVEFGQIDKIEAIPGVKNVYLANEYNRPEEKPDMKTSHTFVQSYQTWADAKFKGEGMVVSVIDTGVDPSHKDFALTDAAKAELTQEEVSQIIEEAGLKGKYFTAKVPYGYNYYDQNQTILDLGPTASMHGMHVAGTVAANGDESNGGIKGVAPEAQVLAMKVFSNDPNYQSTWSDVYLAAIDDSIKLGADVLNMSLGSTASFYEEESPEDIAITRAVENGIVCSVSAGNSGHIGYGWDNPYYKNPDIGVVGAPGLNADTIQVAASGNVAYLYQHNITIEGNNSFSAVGYGIDDWTQLSQVEVVSLSALNGVTEEAGSSCKVCGAPEDYENVDVTGKVVLVKRGTLSFYDKTMNAAAAGAVGIIVYDHGLGAFYENQGGWAIPFMKISAQDGNAFEAALQSGAPVTINVAQSSKKEDPEMGRMTDFTSWGTTPSLELKPEITAPGGKIYSTLQNNEYGVMSGTSMAAPHVAGGSALVQQYLQSDNRFKNLTAGERTRLAKVLLMNTAKVIEDLNGQPFSPRRQGAGMMQTFSAVDTPVYVVNKSTGEAKVELKDFTTKQFEMTLTATNISGKDVTYNVDVSVLTDMFQKVENGEDYNALIAGDMENAVVDAPEKITVPAGESVDFTVKVDLTNAKIPGFDKDGNPTTYDLKEDIFVEGFVTLTEENNAEAPLSVPYVGFYGKWDRPEIVDGFQDLGESKFYGVNGWNDMLFGEGYFAAPVPEKGFYPVSPNGDGAYDDIYPLPAFMRNASEVQFNILDKDQKLLRRVSLEKDVRKTFFDAGSGSYYSFNPARAWDGTVKSEKVEDGLYYYEIKSVIDYDDAKWQSKKIPVYVDTTAPVVEATFDPETSTVSWETMENGTGVESFAIFVNGELVAEVPATETSYVLENVPDKALVEVAAVDYAFNIGVDKAAIGDAELPLIFLNDNTPEPWGAYNSNEVPVEGYVTDDIDVEKVTVNGKEVQVTFDAQTGRYNFSTTAKFEKDGKYDVIVTVVDVAGKEYSISRKVFIDTTKPEIVVDAPKFVDKNVEEVTLNLKLKDNYKYLSLYVDDNHEYELPFKSPVDVLEGADETVKVKVPVQEGNNSFTLRLVDLGGNETIKTVEVYRNETESRLNRIAGANRYATAVTISKQGWETADVVVLARGDNYADALAGIPLAKKHDAPLLLTDSKKLTAVTKAEIKRLGAKKVVILGGESAVNNNVVKELKDMGVAVQRISGSSRFSTAAAIAGEVAPTGVSEAVVVNGLNFPDALSVASYAAAKALPIFLTESDKLPKATKDALHELGVSKTYVVGGQQVVKNDVLIELPNPVRINGNDRYHTSVEVAKFFKASSNHYYVATGLQFADALAGAALAAKDDTGILLVGQDVSASVEKFVKNNGVEKITVIGGKGVVSEEVAKKFGELLP